MSPHDRKFFPLSEGTRSDPGFSCPPRPVGLRRWQQLMLPLMQGETNDYPEAKSQTHQKLGPGGQITAAAEADSEVCPVSTQHQSLES